MYDRLLAQMASIIAVDSDDIALIRSLFKPQSVKKDTTLIDCGDYASFVFFINSGYLRYYKSTENGGEQTIHLLSPGEFATSYCSFVGDTKSEEMLHTLTDAELLYIAKADLEKLYATADKWQQFGRKLIEIILLEKEKRIISQLSLSAPERYRQLLDQNPGLISHVPVQHIASYIGIQPESLSRIRRQLFLTNVR